jgi:ribosome-associated protein
MKYSTPDDEEENLGPSKSALKREMTALQKLGVALVALSRDQLKKVDMPERLRDAIHDAPAVHSARSTSPPAAIYRQSHA